jgi:hypothetical protein
MRSAKHSDSDSNNKGPVPGEKDETFLPPRKAVHPTEKETWLRIFYRSLLWLFVLLVAGLFVWGWQLVHKEI